MGGHEQLPAEAVEAGMVAAQKAVHAALDRGQLLMPSHASISEAILQAAAPSIRSQAIEELRERLLSEAGKALDDPRLLNGFAGIINAALHAAQKEDG